MTKMCKRGKLTNTKAGQLIKEAYKLRREYPMIRMGQAMWNLLPEDLAVDYTGTSADFFHEEDALVVFQKFFDYFVEESEIE